MNSKNWLKTWRSAGAVLSVAAAAAVAAAPAYAGTLTVNGTAAMNGTTKGLEAAITDTTPLYVEDQTPNAEGHYHGKFYLNPNNFDPGEAQGHLRTRAFIGFGNTPSQRRLFAVVLRRQGGQYAVMGRVRQDDNTQHDTGFFNVTAAQHLIEWDWTRSSAVGANNGVFQFYVDGVLKSTLNGNDNDTSGIDFVRMGALSVKSGAGGSIYFDEFASTR